MGRHKKQQKESTSVLNYLGDMSLVIDLSDDPNLVPYLTELPLEERRCDFELHIRKKGEKTIVLFQHPVTNIKDLDGLASFYLNIATRLNETLIS